ncbi:hypothetical protein [Marivirga harenae]|uniref:hypothetical protein n=1 Tax=Marivirga harenae TaxID=2010992 RepID=UPI0026DEBC9D|nr:hypothetical protein [Marivirga harenae]WKV11907.1 hypothetical protein Q3Y49_17030 [Marivirga harenae]|tara:strand:- start:609 stop:842 length:234 start_codon:yes stop_codon:yes gene_type:complete
MKKLFFSLVGGLILTSISSMANSDIKPAEEMRTTCAYVTLSCGVEGPVCGENQANLVRNIEWAHNYFCEGGREKKLN